MIDNNVMEADMTEQEVAQVAAAAQQLELLKVVEELKKEVEKLRNQPKNQRPGVANDKNQYVLLTKDLKMWGKVPQQQVDVAKILSEGMVVGKQYSETEVFAMLVDGCGEYPSLSRGKQDVTYVFRYYRGLKNDGAKYAGYAGRDFLKMV